MQALVPVGNLAAYINWTQSIPVLTKEKSLTYSRRLLTGGELLQSFPPEICCLCQSRFFGLWAFHEDLIQEGNIG